MSNRKPSRQDLAALLHDVVELYDMMLEERTAPQPEPMRIVIAEARQLLEDPADDALVEHLSRAARQVIVFIEQLDRHPEATSTAIALRLLLRRLTLTLATWNVAVGKGPMPWHRTLDPEQVGCEREHGPSLMFSRSADLSPFPRPNPNGAGPMMMWVIDALKAYDLPYWKAVAEVTFCPFCGRKLT